MAIETTAGGTVITGEHVRLYQMMSLRAMLHLETKGLKGRGNPRAAVQALVGSKKRLTTARALKLLEDKIERDFPETRATLKRHTERDRAS